MSDSKVVKALEAGARLHPRTEEFCKDAIPIAKAQEAVIEAARKLSSAPYENAIYPALGELAKAIANLDEVSRK